MVLIKSRATLWVFGYHIYLTDVERKGRVETTDQKRKIQTLDQNHVPMISDGSSSKKVKGTARTLIEHLAGLEKNRGG